MNRVLCILLAACAALCLPSPAARAASVKELARISGQGESVLRGVGLVVGLKGTGDSGKELAVARPLAALLENAGNAIGSPLELSSSKSVALVSVTCVIPAMGARADDAFDVQVSVINSASSLAGGELYLVALRGPFPTDPVYAMAQGLIELPDAAITTSGRVRGGARMIRDIRMPEVGTRFDLIIQPAFAGWASSSHIASAINSRAQPQGPAVAMAIDERTVRVTVPEPERSDKAAFLADVMGAEVNTNLLDLPAQVVVNTRSGSIIFTVDVEISPVAITQRDLTITTTIPPPVPTAQNPLVQRDRWAEIKPDATPRESARLSDLVRAFKQLDIPVNEQINILQMLHKGGNLQAKLVID